MSEDPSCPGCTCDLEPAFLFSGDGPPFEVVDAECEIVATCPNARFAELVQWALSQACDDEFRVCPIHTTPRDAVKAT